MNGETEIRAAIDKSGFAVMTFSGISMLPLLVENRDSVRLVKPEGRLKKYDIALFVRQNGECVLHRVVRVRDSSYLIRGDNCLKSEKVEDSQIVAVAEGVFIGNEYHACSEEKIAKYAARQKYTLPFRKLKYTTARVFRKVFPRR